MTRTFLAIAVAPLALVACSKEEPAARTQQKPASSWLLASAPGEPSSIVDAKASVAQGDDVVIHGRIGGRVEPITAQSPVFLIVDLALPHCGELHGDTCPTPWDYCCEPRESLTAHSATVQLVDADGTPLDVDPVAAGLSPLDEVVVVGTVGPRPSPDVLTIRATGVHRKGS